MEITSSKPKKQRKWHYTKPLHKIQKDFSMHVEKDLRKSIGKRSLEVRKGDTVKIMRGNKKFVGKRGKVTSILRQKRFLLIEGITRKRVDGTEIQVPFRPSNLELVSIEEKDNRRLKGKKIMETEKPKEEKKEVLPRPKEVPEGKADAVPLVPAKVPVASGEEKKENVKDGE